MKRKKKEQDTLPVERIVTPGSIEEHETTGIISPAELTELRSRYPGTLLLFRLTDGRDGYLVLPQDYLIVDQTNVPRSFPTSALEHHLNKLLRSGNRVAICEQVT